MKSSYALIKDKITPFELNYDATKRSTLCVCVCMCVFLFLSIQRFGVNETNIFPSYENAPNVNFSSWNNETVIDQNETNPLHKDSKGGETNHSERYPFSTCIFLTLSLRFIPLLSGFFLILLHIFTIGGAVFGSSVVSTSSVLEFFLLLTLIA